MTTLECLNMLTARFEAAGLYFGHGTETASDEAWWLMHHVLFGSEEFRDIPDNLPLGVTQLDEINKLAAQRIDTRKPLAYLIGLAWFCGLPFEVNEHVLVPRSPLAELISSQCEPLLENPPGRILDLCTGSGCIGIAAALAFPDAEVVLSDISTEALKVAERNIARYDLHGRVSARQSDLFDALEGRFDLILTNPPYVSQTEYETLPEEFMKEPVLGLVTADAGLELPLRILDQAPDFLTPEGVLVLEVGNTWESLEQARPDLPFLWLEFEQGGHGVCALSAQALGRQAD